MITNYRSREYRKLQVTDAVRALNNGLFRGKPTMYRIARLIGLRPSSHLTGIINELVQEGTLRKRTIKGRPGRWDTVYYSLVDQRSPGISQVRDIPIKAAGQTIGQLEMWS